MFAKKNMQPGPCPDPEKYILVTTKEGCFWRRKRGTLKPARLNTSFRKNVINSKVAAPAAKRVIQKLQPFLRDLQTGRLNVRLTAAFIKSMNEKGQPDFSYLQGLNMHEQPLKNLLTGYYNVLRCGNEIKIEIAIEPNTVKQPSESVTGYYFEAILLYGDVTKDNGLHIDSAISPLYSFGSKSKSVCILSLDVPTGNLPWMVLLKVSCQKRNRPDGNVRRKGMEVVGVGGDNF